MNVETAKKTNPYVVKLSLLDKEDTLNGYSQVIITYIITHCSILKLTIMVTM